MPKQHVALLLVALLLVGVAHAQCPTYSTGQTLWSTAYGSLQAGADVVITTTVWLDTSTPVLGDIEIQNGGALYFKPGSGAISLRAHQIYIRSGAIMAAGCATAPYTDPAEIVLYGKKSDYPNGLPAAPGIKVINVNGGTLQIYAGVPSTTWTLLTETAEYDIYAPAGTGGASTIKVLDNVSAWPVGSKIIIASTDYNADLSEVRTVTAVSADGHTITLDSPLKYQHYGKIWSWPGGRDYVDERAEVGLLTRSFKIYGDTSDGESDLPWIGLGAQVFVNQGSLVKISGVELFDVGQRGELARYPIHFHMCGDMTGSLIEKNSFHDTFQRCLTVHGTNYLDISDNVAYNSTGHCYFIEDGTEMYNTFTHNLGVVAKPPCCPDSNGNYAVNGSGWQADTRLLATDEEPSIFWITHPYNNFVNNSAVGGQFGYWYSLPATPIGVSYQDPLTNKQLLWPQLSPGGTFYGNKAHSCNEDGLFVDRGITENPPCATGTKDQCGDAPENTSYRPKMGVIDIDPTIPLTSAQILDYINNQPYAYSVFEEFTAHHCRGVGMWGRGNGIIAIAAHLADNQIGAQFPGEGHIMIDSVFVAETDNIGNPGRDYGQDARTVEGRTRPVTYRPEQPIIGYRTYDAGGPDFGFNNRFYNFQMFFFEFDFKIRYAGAFSGQGGPNVITPRTKFYNNTFFNTSDYCRFYVYPGHDNAFHGWVMPDVDGTLTGGLQDFDGGCGSWVVANNNSILLGPGCQFVWGWNAHLCPGDGVGMPLRAHRIGNYDDSNPLPILNDWGPGVTLLGVWTRLSDGANSTMEPDHYSDLPASPIYPEGGNSVQLSYPNTLRVGEEYLFQFGLGNTPSKFSISMSGMYPGNADQGTLSSPEWIRFAIPFPSGTTYAIKGDDGSDCVQVTSRAALTYNTYFVEPSSSAGTDLLWVHMQPDGVYYSYWRYGLAYIGSGVGFKIAATCPNNNCAVGYPTPVPTASEPATLPPRPFTHNCENGARNAAGGTMSYTLSGASSIIFDDAVQTGWSIPNWVGLWELSSALPGSEQPPGVQGVCLVMEWTPYYSIRFTINGGIPVNSLTHLRFDVRSGTGIGPLDIGVSMSGLDDKNLGQDVRANTPWALAGNAVPDDTKWSTIYISLADILLDSPATSQKSIKTISIYNAQGRNTTVYIDNVSLGSYTASLVTVPPPNPSTASTVTGQLGTGSGPAGRPLNGFVPPTGSVPLSGSASTMFVSVLALLFAILVAAAF